MLHFWNTGVKGELMNDSVCLIEFHFRDDTYAIRYEKKNWRAAMRVVGRWASNPELSLTWQQASRIAWLIRETEEPPV
jgi:hypothetical protein